MIVDNKPATYIISGIKCWKYFTSIQNRTTWNKPFQN